MKIYDIYTRTELVVDSTRTEYVIKLTNERYVDRNTVSMSLHFSEVETLIKHLQEHLDKRKTSENRWKE